MELKSKSKSVKSKSVKSKSVKSKSVKSKSVKSKLVKSKSIKSKFVKLKPVKSKPVKSKSVKSKSVKPKSVKPKSKFPSTHKEGTAEKISEAITKYKSEYAEQAYVACAELGAGVRSLAKLFKVDVQTIYNWMRNHEDFFELIKNGRDFWDTIKIEKSLKNRARGYKYTEIKTRNIELVKGKGKNRIALPAVEITKTVKHVPSEPSCLFFWLQNRSHGRWKNAKYALPPSDSPEDMARKIKKFADAIFKSVPSEKKRKKKSAKAK